MNALLLFILALALDASGDVLSYVWAKSKITLTTLLSATIPIYAVSWYFWSLSMRRGLEVWWTGTIWSLVGVISGVLVGHYFGESIAPKDWVGICFAIIAIVLLTL